MSSGGYPSATSSSSKPDASSPRPAECPIAEQKVLTLGDLGVVSPKAAPGAGFGKGKLPSSPRIEKPSLSTQSGIGDDKMPKSSLGASHALDEPRLESCAHKEARSHTAFPKHEVRSLSTMNNAQNDSLGTYTTLSIRHVPKSYTEDALILEMENLIGKGTFDFFYMPWDEENNANQGKAYINFVTPMIALNCITQLTEYKFKIVSSSKPAKVSPASVQGLVANIQSLAPKMNPSDAHAPRVWRKGKIIDFQKAIEKYITKAKEKDQKLVEAKDDETCAQKEETQENQSSEGVTTGGKIWDKYPHLIKQEKVIVPGTSNSKTRKYRSSGSASGRSKNSSESGRSSDKSSYLDRDGHEVDAETYAKFSQKFGGKSKLDQPGEDGVPEAAAD